MKGTNSNDRNEKGIKILIEQLRRKRGLDKLMHRWTDNIKKYFQELVLGVMDWVVVA